jgi:hypothetical protein
MEDKTMEHINFVINVISLLLGIGGFYLLGRYVFKPQTKKVGLMIVILIAVINFLTIVLMSVFKLQNLIYPITGVLTGGMIGMGLSFIHIPVLIKKQ